MASVQKNGHEFEYMVGGPYQDTRCSTCGISLGYFNDHPHECPGIPKHLRQIIDEQDKRIKKLESEVERLKR